MTIFNHSHRFIFVHVPKSAGTSLTKIFSSYTSYSDQEIGGTEYGQKIAPHYRKRFGIGKHSPAREILSVVGEETWESYFTFGFVRNPYERCLSSYHFLRKWDGEQNKLYKKMNSFKSFDQFVKSGLLDETNGPDNIFQPQTHWLCGGKDNSLLVNFVGKVENIYEDVMEIKKSIVTIDTKEQVYEGEIPSLNKSRNPVGRNKESCSQKALDIIMKKYASDFEVFDYTYEATNSFAKSSIS